MAAERGVLDPELERTSNRVELVGYLGRPPERRYNVEREPVIVLSLATHRWVEEPEGPRQFTDWHRVIARGSLVGVCEQLQVGQLLRVQGRLYTSSWIDGRGHQQHRTEVVLEELQPEPTLVRQIRLLPLAEPGHS
jgi:single-strand DNA-binding protein